MTEEKAKKRGWVKNAAIVFLAVMLVLTLFSSTIMNASLPEVAQQAAQQGTINAKIRGSGTVEANSTYEVILEQSYKVAGVSVRVGDNVEAGDTLFTLEGAESADLRAAREALEDAQLQYRMDLVSAASSTDHAAESREIERAQQKLDKAIADRDEKVILPEELNAAQAAIDASEGRIDDIEARIRTAKQIEDDARANVDKIQSELSQYSPNGVSTYDILKQIEAAHEELKATELAYTAELSELRELAKQEMEKDNVAVSESGVEMYMHALSIRPGTDEALRTAYNAVKAINDSIASLERQYSSIEDSDTSGQYQSVKRKLDKADEEYQQTVKVRESAERDLESENKVLEDAKKKLDDLKAKEDEYKQADNEVENCQLELDNLIFALEQKILSESQESGRESAIRELELEGKRMNIQRLSQRVNELVSSSAGSTVTAPQAGKITAVNVTAGSTADAGIALAVIETPDLGYTLSLSVTAEQAKKVAIGDVAEVSNYWWGAEITATLRQIKADPQSPMTSKLLVFDVKGDEVESGTALSLSIGQRSQNYDVVIPNSAVRSDSNGSFVLVVEAKSVPLGTRYTARRVDVNVLESDDTNTAVSGGLSAWNDWVITTSSAPIEPGMQVRLAEN